MCAYLNWKYINVKTNEPLGWEDSVRYTKFLYVIIEIWYLYSVYMYTNKKALLVKKGTV